MARKRQIRVSAINLRIVEETKREYKRLFEVIDSMKIPIRVHGDTHMVMKNMSIHDDRISGILAKFTVIDPNSDWIDLVNLEKVEEEGLERISIPKGYNPNMRQFFFEFKIVGHTIFVETYGKQGSCSIGLYKSYFDGVFMNPQFLDEFGLCAANIITLASELPGLKRFLRIKEVTIAIESPNVDLGGPAEKAFEEKLKRRNARVIVETSKERDKEGLQFDEEMDNAALVALRHGSVHVKGVDEDGKLVKRSSEESYAEQVELYDPDLMGENQGFGLAVDNLTGALSDEDGELL